ncbi:MAG: hypothetical protein QXG65_00955 [Thermoplasmata archaeon]
MSSPSGRPVPADEQALVERLREAIRRSPEPPVGIEVGIPLSIALGRRRPAVSCGGCSVPLEFDGIPARTNPHLEEPFRLILRADRSRPS